MLKKAGIIEHNLESELILMHILNWEKAVLISNLNRNLNDNEISKNNKIIDKRIKRIPLPYILNKIHFFGIPFYINKNVLIPRQETELIIEITKKLAVEQQYSDFKILEIGSGSGIISIALAKELNNKKIEYILTDISGKALEVSLKNISQLNKNNNNKLPKRIAKMKFPEAETKAQEVERFGFADCPYDYFTEDLKKAYYKKISKKRCGPKEIK